MTEILIILFAALIHGALGLGFPITATPLLAWQGSLMRAIQLTLIPTIAINTLTIAQQPSPWQAFRPFLSILPAIVIGTITGSLFIIYFNPDIFRVLMALVIIAFLWLDRKKQLEHTNPGIHTRGVFLTGLATGFLVGTVNAGVPALIIFVLYNRLSREQGIVLFNSCFMTGKFTQLALFGGLGILDAEWQKMGFMLLFVAVIGVLIGLWLGKYLDQARWRAAMRWILLLIAVSLIYRVFSTLMQ